MRKPRPFDFEITEEDRKRFWSKVDIKGPDECWEWNGTKRSNGYGLFYIDGWLYGAQRIVLVLTNGKFDPRLCGCHHCDNPGCVNPDHLFIGTHRDNGLDMSRKGRSSAQRHPDKVPRGDNHYTRTHPEKLLRGDSHWSHIRPEMVTRGEHHGMAKLTEDQVTEIRKRYSTGGVSQSQLGAIYGIGQVHVSKIIRRQIWRNVP